MSGGIVSGGAVRDTTPDPDDWAYVVRGIGFFPSFEAVLQAQYDMFVSNTNLIYVGYAAIGQATSAASWLIKRITFASGNPTQKMWSSLGFTAIWDDRIVIPYS